MQTVAASGEAVRRFGFDVFGVEAIAGAGFGFELRPELADLETFRDPAPETVQPHAEGNGGAEGCPAGGEAVAMGSGRL